MLLSEIFRPPSNDSEVTWNDVQSDYVATDFKIGNNTYAAYAQVMSPHRIKDQYFEGIPTPWPLAEAIHTNSPVWEFEFSTRSINGARPRNNYGINGGGNAIGVMTVAISLLQQLMQMHPKSLFMFTAGEPQRAKLYERMAKRLAGDISVTSPTNGSGTAFFVMS